MKLRFYLVALLCATAPCALAQLPVHAPMHPPVHQALTTVEREANSRHLVDFDTTYTFSGDFDDSRLGSGTSLYSYVSYDHRFPVTGSWYLRTGIEYERFDFGGSDNGLPEHLQAVFGHLAFEYVVKNRAAAGIRLHPGFYFQDQISGDAFDVPWKIFAGFPLKKNKVFAFIGVGGGLYQNPPIGPGGGIVWLISDNLRLEGVFPKPALVYNATDDWQFRLYGDLVYQSFRTDDVVTKKFELHNAVVEYGEMRVGAQVSYSGVKGFKIIAAGGCTFLREFDFYRADYREKVEPAPFVRFSIEGKF